MKVLGWKAVLVLVLSLALWSALYVAFPTAPPDPADSTVIVGVMLVLVLGTSSLVSWLRKDPAAAGTAAAEEAAAPAEATVQAEAAS